MSEVCGKERKDWAFILGCCILAMVILSLILFVIMFVLVLVVVNTGQSNQKAVEDANQKGRIKYKADIVLTDIVICSILLFICNLALAVENFPGPQGRSGETDKTFDTIRIFVYVIFGISMVLCLVEIGFSVVLILGAKRCSQKMLNCWVWAGIVFCVLHIICGVGGSYNGAHVYIGTGLVLVVLYILALIVVWPLRAECEDGGAGPAAGQSKVQSRKTSAGKGAAAKTGPKK